MLQITDLNLLVCDECHRAVKKDPYNCIMQEFYHDRSSEVGVVLPVLRMLSTPSIDIFALLLPAWSTHSNGNAFGDYLQCKALKAIYDSRGTHASTSATSHGHAYVTTVVVKAHGQLLSMLLYKVLMVLCFNDVT